jgi:hypothetical protein
MNVHDWHLSGLEPAFATIEQWIDDQLGFAGAEDEGCFATEIRPATARAGLAIRILIATDKGLFDMLWERPSDPAARHLSSTLHRWPEVTGAHLLATTRLDPQTLMHGEPEWGILMTQPEVSLPRVEEGPALLEFWKACEKELKKALKG